MKDEEEEATSYQVYDYIDDATLEARDGPAWLASCCIWLIRRGFWRLGNWLWIRGST